MSQPTSSSELKTGACVKIDGLDDPQKIIALEFAGTFLQLTTESLNTKNRQTFYLNPKSREIKFLEEGLEATAAEIPTRDIRQTIHEADRLQLGMLVEARSRIWRIDGINTPKQLVTVSSVSGKPAKHELFLPIEDLSLAQFPLPDPGRVGNLGYQRLLLRALRLDLIHGTAILM
ncbi:MAG: hypothetical protein ACE5OZ_26245, partial [Candidatus Heimdallarchaeota archaeon]